ncbi:MAG: hypothetical protein ABSG97_06735 [Sedimentisphaerales bacterium]
MGLHTPSTQHLVVSPPQTLQWPAPSQDSQFAELQLLTHPPLPQVSQLLLLQLYVQPEQVSPV